MIDPKNTCLFIPPGLKKFKLQLFNEIGKTIKNQGGIVIQGDYNAIINLPNNIIPIVGVSPEFRKHFAIWKNEKRNFIFWDRGYFRRVFATWMPTGNELGIPGGYYRWTLNNFQMAEIKNVSDERWKQLKLHEINPSVGVGIAYPWPWKKTGKHIVVADTGHDYWDVFADRDWCSRTIAYLKQYTDRPIILRDKECKIPLYDQLDGAHALVAHGSIAAVEAVAMGYPVFVDHFSAAASVGCTDFSHIENPVYPERGKWLNSLACHQWNEKELVDGTLWRQIT